MTAVDRLRAQPMPSDQLFAWVVTVAIAVLAFAIRIVGIGSPNKLVFDETYYPKDAWSLLHFGYEKAWPTAEDTNTRIAAGDTDIWLDNDAFIVHPPLGKWLIALGEHTFGMNSVGWRISACVFGVLLVAVTIRMVRRLTRSTLLGATAGILLTFDGLAFVMSRIGLLDGFQAFFLIAAVSCLLADRDWFRERVARGLERAGLDDLGGLAGPIVWWRPWRVAAGVMFGCALAVKWNSIYLLAAFGLLTVAWDVGARRLAGASRRAILGLVVDGVPAFVSMVVLAVAVYLSSWTGWLLTQGGYDRQWGAEHPEALSTRTLGAPLASLLQYHRDIYAFHTGDYMAGRTHPYDAHPIGWLVVARPIGIDAVNGIKPGVDGCVGPDNCQRVISGIGTPVLWWVGVIALVVAVIWWIGRRDWRFGVPVVGVAASWLPWFQYTDRPQFFFYAILIIPFTVTAVALGIGLLIGPGPGRDRRRGAIISAVFVALVLANFAYLYPILTDGLLTYPQWLSRMWFRSWI